MKTRLSDRERHGMVVDAVFFGIRATAFMYGVSPSTVHRWVHDSDYNVLVGRCKLAIDRLARDIRLTA